MTYLNVGDTKVSTVPMPGPIYFVGPGSLFSRIALRTVETELDGPTQRVPDINALQFAQRNAAGVAVPAYMVVVHESAARDLLKALRQGAGYLPKTRLAIAFEREDAACALFADACDELLQWRVSLLPMNTNVTNWVRLLQVIQAGGHYLPPDVLHPKTQTMIPGEETARPVPDAGARARSGETLTPRESEVLSMAAAGSPNKTIAGELALSEHTVKLYMHRIIGKLGVRNRTEAAIWYHQNSNHA